MHEVVDEITEQSEEPRRINYRHLNLGVYLTISPVFGKHPKLVDKAILWFIRKLNNALWLGQSFDHLDFKCVFSRNKKRVNFVYIVVFNKGTSDIYIDDFIPLLSEWSYSPFATMEGNSIGEVDTVLFHTLEAAQFQEIIH